MSTEKTDRVPAAGARTSQLDRTNALTFNPSDWNRRLLIVLLAGIDLVIACHLALYQSRLLCSVWDPVFGAEQSRLVLDSSVSEFFRNTFLVPDAAIGAAAYLAEVILGLVGSRRRWREHPWLVVAFGLNALLVALIGLALIVLQPTVVGAWCLLCLVTAVLSIVMLALALPEVLASLRHLLRNRSKASDSS